VVRFKRGVETLSRLLDVLAAIAVVLTMSVVVLNIILRSVFKHPLTGIMDYVMILTALTIALALANCAIRNGHIAIDLFIDKLPIKVGGLFDTLTNFASFIFWVIAAVFMFEYAATMYATGTVFPTTQIPMAPVLGIIGGGLLALAVVVLYRLLNTVRKLVI
jgi:TRAP-type C4-dicarboxylate transport system permease small subunit